MRPILVGTLFLVALLSPACKTLKPVTLDELRVMRAEQVWITQNDQTVVVVSAPQLLGDTLVGYVNGKYEEIPTAQFKQVVAEKVATGKTAALVSVIAVGFGAMVYALIGGKGDTRVCDPSYCEEHEEDPCCA